MNIRKAISSAASKNKTRASGSGWAPRQKETLQSVEPAAKQTARAKSANASLKEGPPAHILIRVRAEDGQTFEEHSKIIRKSGSAFLGKMGAAVGPSFIRELNGQIKAGSPTFLFLTTREGWNGPYVAYRCKLISVETSLPDNQRHLAPKYYASHYPTIKTWFNIASMEKLSREEMNRIYVVSSGRHIMSVIKSSAVVFRVSIGS